jgi:hypothetical protein
VAVNLLLFFYAIMFCVVVQLEEEGFSAAGNIGVFGIPGEICLAPESFAE